jgi:hypothetical protein
MTIAVRIQVEAVDYSDGSKAEAVLYAYDGKKKSELHRFTKATASFEGHMWKGRNLILEEEIVPAPKPKHQDDNED